MATTSVSVSAQRPVIGAPPRWVTIVTPILSILGLALATYLTITHFQPHALVCGGHGIVNCGEVTTSGESRFLGIPIVFLGLAQFLAMTALCTPWAWRSQRREVHLARLVLAAVGMGFVVWLVAAELLIIGAICLYCSGVHLVTFALFACIVATVPAMLGWTER